MNLTLSTAATNPGPVHPPLDSPLTEAEIPIAVMENEILPSPEEEHPPSDIPRWTKLDAVGKK